MLTHCFKSPTNSEEIAFEAHTPWIPLPALINKFHEKTCSLFRSHLLASQRYRTEGEKRKYLQEHFECLSCVNIYFNPHICGLDSLRFGPSLWIYTTDDRLIYSQNPWLIWFAGGDQLRHVCLHQKQIQRLSFLQWRNLGHWQVDLAHWYVELQVHGRAAVRMQDNVTQHGLWFPMI